MMNNYYTLIYLVNELDAILQGASFQQAVTHRKNILDMLFTVKNGEELKLTFSADPLKTAVFTDSRTSVRKSNTAAFFEILEGETLRSISIASSDRILYFHFDEYKLVLAMFGHQPNVFLCKNDAILDAFKNPEKFKGQAPPSPYKPQQVTFSETKGSLKKRIQKVFPLFPRNFIDDVITRHNLEVSDLKSAEQVFNQIIDQITESPEPGILEDGRFTLIGDGFLPQSKSEKFDSCIKAVRVAFYTEVRENRFAGKKAELLGIAEKMEKRFTDLVQAGEQAWKSLERAERYEQFGNLLISSAHLPRKQTEFLEVQDFYNNNDIVKIPTDPLKDIAANAGDYFEKKKKAESSYEYTVEASKKAAVNLKEIITIKNKLLKADSEAELQKVTDEYKDSILFRDKKGVKEQDYKPYKVLNVNGYTVWIGKNAKSNDALLRDAHKEDIWMHSRDTTGSHILIRMNKSAHDPDMGFLEKVAGWAAWLSKARGSSLCPVVYTRMKFVRKPKNAPAGQAIFEKEKVILAEPLKPD